MADKFLILELREPKLNRVLTDLRSIFSGKKHLTNIHITLKGPQKTIPLAKGPQKTIVFANAKDMEEYKSKNAIIQIGGVGRFLNGAFHVVYLGVKCGDLRKYKLWRKPNYKEDYNPHITLYEGTDRLLADAVYEFLTLENIEYECDQYDFTIHTRGEQFNLFLDAFSQDQICLPDKEEALCERARRMIKRVYAYNDCAKLTTNNHAVLS